MRILILGGTIFLGRHLTQLALERGHDVTLFNRGLHGADLFPDAERLVGDRAGNLSALEHGTWDIVFDTCGFTPQDVRATAELLRDRVTRYVFVSSVSVYRDWPARGVDETAPTHEGTDPANYGALKACCEEALEAEMPRRVLHVRSGLLVGPYENIGRLPYWLDRIASYHAIVAPGRPLRSVQLHDARDLAKWMLDSAESGLVGVFNTGAPPDKISMHALLKTCIEVTGSDATLRWVNDETLLATEVAPWTEIPLWAPETSDYAGIFSIDVAQAIKNGLSSRSFSETARDTWSWLRDAQPPELEAYRDHQRSAVLDRRKEIRLLATPL